MDADAESIKATTELPSTKDTNFVNCVPRLVNVLYPGIVKNVNKAIQTLGGIRDIESVTTANRKYLELSFEPNNLCRKPVFSNQDTKPQILLKVRTKKCIQDGKVVSKEIVDYNVVGLTAINIKFTKLCDFQYLPLVPKSGQNIEDELVYIYDDIIPKKLPDSAWLSDEQMDAMPLYFTPYQFSKTNIHGNQLQFNRSQVYEGRFMPEYCDKFKEAEKQKAGRKDRDKFTKTTMLIRIEDEIPKAPNQQAQIILREKNFPKHLLDKFTKLYEERPIWSRNALLYYTETTNEQMRYILPAFAFHYVSGPWRVLWVRFGYDPRAEPSSKLLQCFDYRIRGRMIGGGRIVTKAKRKALRALQLNTPGGPSKFSLSSIAATPNPARAVDENSFILRPGCLPAARQTFYQYCDVKLPDIENMLTKLPTILPGSNFDMKHGWLPSGFVDQCREIVNKYVNHVVAEEAQAAKKRINQRDSSESSSDSNSSGAEISEGEECEDQAGIEDIIDLEAVDEINQLLGQTNQALPKEPMPGPSSAKN